MPVNNGVGWSNTTPDKAYGFEKLLSQHFAIVKTIFKGRQKYPYYYIDCTSGPGYIEPVETEGSPLIFLRRAQPGQQVGQVKEKFPEPDAGQRRDAVGAKLGMSGKTYDKVKTLYDYAKEGNELAMYYMVEADAGRMSIDKAFKKFLEVNGRNNIHGFNKTNDNIEWAKWTWNPVTGCKYNCEYCYARDIGMRFNGTFDPEFHPERLHAPEVTTIPKNPDQGDKTVFVCSMGELFGEWIPNEWILPVIDVVKKNSQWNFLFLTKNPKRLPEFSFPENAWVGTTVDIQSRVASAEKAMREVQAKIKFLSCEPLLEPVRFNDLSVFNWLIIGGRSQNSRGPASQPEWMWVESLLNQAREAGVSVYFKPNLTVRPREYPGMSSS